MATYKNCITGCNDYLYSYIKESMKKATKVDIIVSFLMESGVKLLREDLQEIADKNIPIRILTGNYLNITQPSALYLLKDIFKDKIDLRFYNDKRRSFHPKAYIFEYENGGDIFIGSSNISKSALTSGIEWNYRLSKENNKEDYHYYKDTFEDLFMNHSIIVNDEELDNYSKNWKKTKLSRFIDEEDEHRNISNIFEPRGAQIEALYELKRTREDGNDKGLVVAATGIGKTYLAAFDSRKFNKILFVAHREEILKQAQSTFKTIRSDISTGFFMNSEKDINSDIIFASVQSLGKEEYLNEKYFKKDYFDYIVVDEFHHAVSKNYQNIINYFEPKFMLGLTATPYRLDNKDVLDICDYNVVYEAPLRSAINKGWLVPFRYYGIYDESINYEEIEFKYGKYNEKQLEEKLSINKRANLILGHYKKYKSNSALGFCTSKSHAEFMAKYFNDNGIKSCAVYSGNKGEYNEDRNIALIQLQNGEIKVIFSVDMFNEGLDIKSIDMVMFLRPTESPVVFLQQLGRGLRKDKDKKYLNVLDFIGNYNKANLAPYLLTGSPKDYENKKNNKGLPSEEDYPEDCFIDFDFRLVDIFEKMEKANAKIQDRINEEFYRIKEDLGYVPSRVELFKYIDEAIYNTMRKNSKLNIFRNYMGYLDKINELTINEKNLINTFGYDFINMVETTSMSKTYKLPIFLAFYNNKNMKLVIDDEDVYKSFKDFYSKGSNKVDMLRDKSTANFKDWGIKEYVKLAKNNPIKFLAKSSSEFFYIDNDLFYINENLQEYINNEAFLKHFKDSIDFRNKEFYKNRLESKYK